MLARTLTMMRLRYFQILIITSCSVSSGIKNSSSSRPYDFESTTLHVKAVSQLKVEGTFTYIQLDRSELLYTRENPNSKFISKIQFNYLDVKTEIVDTLKSDSPRELNIVLESILDSEPFNLEVVDLNRKTSNQIHLRPNGYLVWDHENDWAVYGSSLSVGAKIEIRRDDNEEWYVRTVDPKPFLPDPPFTGGRNKYANLTDTLTGKIQGSRKQSNIWTIQEGAQRFSSSIDEDEFVLYGRSNEFPKMINVYDLIEATRYIATISEYKALTSADHPKQALDDFWMKCGDTPEKSKELIKIYYGRVEEANRYFSGLLEGWRTDRGMIHIVMGPPNRVNRDNWGEYWVYGDEASNNNITFRFKRRSHLIDNNIYILERNSLYRMTWESFVTSWRNGRVYRD